jgi:aspartyl-tRNA(Asn)/glutamyl-tRNA(Gln) amidotransferase subunit A
MTGHVELTATQIVAQVHAGSLSVVDLVRALLERIERLDDRVKAWVTVDAAGALAAAEALDAEARGGRVRPLHGVPVGVKDIIDVAGLPTEAGFAPYRGSRAGQDAAIVARLRDLGAVMLGKAHTTQFAFADPAPTRNPYDLERTPGGSSSGSAAAVAARMVPAALGTQTAGSVVRPAAYCGVVGFKPSFNWFSREGVLPLSWALDHLGLIVRTAEDAVLVFDALTGESARVAGRAAPRIGVPQEFVERSEPHVAAHLREIGRRLRDAGAELHEVRLPVEFDLLLAVHHVIMQTEVAAVHAEPLLQHPDAYGPQLRVETELGQAIPAAFDLKARRLRRALAAEMEAFQAGYDALLLPAASNTAPTPETTGDRTFQAPWSLLGSPSITLPTGLSAEGLPLASQLVARRGQDRPLLSVAAWCEDHLGLIAPPVLD